MIAEAVRVQGDVVVAVAVDCPAREFRRCRRTNGGGPSPLSSTRAIAPLKPSVIKLLKHFKQLYFLIHCF